MTGLAARDLPSVVRLGRKRNRSAEYHGSSLEERQAIHRPELTFLGQGLGLEGRFVSGIIRSGAATPAADV